MKCYVEKPIAKAYSQYLHVQPWLINKNIKFKGSME